MSMPLLELTLQRQAVRDAERDLSMLRMVLAGAGPLTGSKAALEIHDATVAALQRVINGPNAGPSPNSPFQRLLAKARADAAIHSAKTSA